MGNALVAALAQEEIEAAEERIKASVEETVKAERHTTDILVTEQAAHFQEVLVSRLPVEVEAKVADEVPPRVAAYIEAHPAPPGKDGEPGKAGIDGANGSDGEGISWRGPWKAGSYDAQDAVELDGSSYIARARTRAKPPGGAWDLMAKRGSDGGTVFRPSLTGGGGSSSSGSGLPVGGVQGQALVKASATNGDAVWGPFGLLPDPGVVWAAGTRALGYRISVPGTNLSFLVWEVTTAGTTGVSIPDFEAVPLNSAPITDGTVVWTFQGYVGKVIGGKSLEATRASDGSTGSSVILEDAQTGAAGDLYIRGGHGAAGNDGGKVGIQGGFSDAGAIDRAYLEVTAGDVGDLRGGRIYALAGSSELGNVGAQFIIYGGDDDGANGGRIQLIGGDGIAGNKGGFAEIRAGFGALASVGADIFLEGGAADGVTPGRVQLTTDGVTGNAGQVLTAQGDTTAIWDDPAGGLTPGSYTISNDTTDRTFNANATTLDELADIVATLIRDLGGA